jgi:cbb3-type cytochrome c oxidase subunit III
MVAPGTVSADLRKFPKEDFERFRNVVLNGKGPAMPPWRDKITDEDLTTLWAYVRSGG